MISKADLLQSSLLKAYLKKTPLDDIDTQACAYLANLDHLISYDAPVAKSIMKELEDQRHGLKLIASENYSSLAVQMAMGNWLTDKYAEGYPSRRFYAGCENVDAIESLAASRACELFGAEFAFTQPHCGADANLLAFMAIIFERIQLPWLHRFSYKTIESLPADKFEELRKACMNEKLLGMSLSCGGHLTHGFRMNISARLFQPVYYEVDPHTGLLDYDKIREIAKRERPLILLAGYSAYPRLIDFSIMRSIADEVNAVLLADMAHFAGLVAGGVITGKHNPIPYAHITTTTTHKTLRGPRGGLILSSKEFSGAINKACPMMMGGPLPHVMAAKAISFKEALDPSFKSYSQQICLNAKALASKLMELGFKLLTDGTDNHMVLIDLRDTGLSGKLVEDALRQVGITVNRNAIPGDPLGPWLTSGLRVGTPALTTLGMKENEMYIVANLITQVIRYAQNFVPNQSSDIPADKGKLLLEPHFAKKINEEIRELKASFALYPQIPNLMPWIDDSEKKY
jgi:glycine hydroxymethyltransferase